MSKYSFKVVPFIGRIKNGQGAGVVSAQLQELIDKYSEEGWDFYQLSSTNIEVSPGCIAGLMGAKESYITYDQVIFRKAI